jgi:hypothetical protein
MENKDLTKLCPNCDGSVAMDVTICPYCGSSVFEINENNVQSKSDDSVKSLSAKETLDSLYPPPYRPRSYDAPIEKEPIKEEKIILNKKQTEAETQEEEEEEEEYEEEDYKSSLLPTILFYLGINILFFSILLLIFSKEGFLNLKFNSKYWYGYLIAALPLVLFGYRKLRDL